MDKITTVKNLIDVVLNETSEETKNEAMRSMFKMYSEDDDNNHDLMRSYSDLLDTISEAADHTFDLQVTQEFMKFGRDILIMSSLLGGAAGHTLQ